MRDTDEKRAGSDYHVLFFYALLLAPFMPFSYFCRR